MESLAESMPGQAAMPRFEDGCLCQAGNEQSGTRNLSSLADAPCLNVRLPEHQRRIHAVARFPELDEPPAMHDPVDHRRRKLVVPQDRSPFAELGVGREDHVPPLVAAGNHLEQQPRAFDVDRNVPELVQYDQVVPVDILHHRLEPVLPAGLRQRQRQLGGGVGPDHLAGHHACAADRDGQMRLAAPGQPMEHEILGRIDERQVLKVVHAVAVRERDLREVVPVERFELRELRPSVQPGAPVPLPDAHLVSDKVADGPQPGRVGRREEPLYHLVAEVERAGQPAQPFRIALRPRRHPRTPLRASRRARPGRRARRRRSSRPPPSPRPWPRSPRRASR